MAGNRTLKLSILAETADLIKGLDQANKETQTFGDKVENGFAKVGKAAALAGAAIGALALKLSVDGVKAAIEDEAAQRKLEETIRASTDATALQIDAVAEYIDKTQLATGVVDDQLRPALSRLIRSTQNTEEAQKLLNLALDITAATGKPLEAVANALGKAYDGNATSLGRLGLGIDAGILKSKDFNKIYETLAGTFGSFAENEAKSLEGRFRILNIAVDEAKESIGYALLPQLVKVANFLTEFGVPALNAFIAGLTGKGGLGTAIGETSPRVVEMNTRLTSAEAIANELGKTIRTVGSRFAELFAIFDTATGGQGSAVAGLEKALKALNAVAQVTSKVFEVINVTVEGIVQGFKDIVRWGNQAKEFFGKINPFGARQTSFDVPTMTAPSTSNLGSGSANYITVNGAIDPEGTARTIINVLNNSQSRGTLGAGALVF